MVVSGWCTISDVALEKFMFALLLVVEICINFIRNCRDVKREYDLRNISYYALIS
jgi:hypothetical protein